MAKYIHLFDTDEEFQAMYNDDEKYIEPWASYTRETDSCGYNKPDPLAKPFTIEMLENGSMYTYLPYPISYSINGGAWISLNGEDYLDVGLSSGDTVSFKGNSGISFAESITGAYNVYGNFMSLVCGDDFATATTIPQDAYLGNLLANTSVISAENLLLPATTLVPQCYSGMFFRCESLTAAPVLPATTLAVSCYYNMFYGCSSLTTAPALPATTLAEGCYYEMFAACVSLTTAPTLPATTLAETCYQSMFAGCSGLTTAPALPATTLALSCYYEMFSGCESLTTAPALPATALTESCYNSMFNGCTSLTTAPVLPATALAANCYYDMFYGCSYLSSCTILATGLTAEDISSYAFFMFSLAGEDAASSVLYCANADMVTLFQNNTWDLGLNSGNWTIQVVQ